MSTSANLPAKTSRSSARALVLLPLVATVVALGLAELFVRLFVPVRLVGPPISVYDSVYGVRNRPAFSGTQTTAEFRWHFTTNSYGFRGAEPKGTPIGGILYLGDSFTVGYGVNDGEEYPALVHFLLTGTPLADVPVINAGRGNTGQGHWVKFLRGESAQFAPRAVVLQVSANDFEDNVRERLFTLTSGGGLIEHPVPEAGIGRTVQRVMDRVPWLENSYLFGLFRQAYHSMTLRRTVPRQSASAGPIETMFAQENAITFALLTEVARMCRERDLPAVALLIGLPEARLTATEALLDSLAIPYATVPEHSFRPDLYYRIDGHLNAEGHSYAAKAVAELLVRNELNTPSVPEDSLWRAGHLGVSKGAGRHP